MPQNIQKDTIPQGPLKIAALEGCREFAAEVDRYLVEYRHNSPLYNLTQFPLTGYCEDSYLIDIQCPRFGTGEGKGIIHDSVRGADLFILVDVLNYSITYTVCGEENHMSPDNHYADLKRIISAANGKAKRITVVMPFLYGGRQHRRTKRESLDCAYMLMELEKMGISNFITFDAHDPRVQNAIPLTGFTNYLPTYQFIKTCFQNIPDLKIDKESLMIISPDEGAMDRAIYLATIMGVDLGMFYKRRDYSKVLNGRNPIVAHEFLGSSVVGKDVIIMDDMIDTAGTICNAAKAIKDLGAKTVYAGATHAVLSGPAIDRIRDSVFEEMILLNTIPPGSCY